MPLVHKAKAFYMRQCLECHRHPEHYVSAPIAAAAKIDTHLITNCSACHR
jgi:hypothetical protein